MNANGDPGADAEEFFPAVLNRWKELSLEQEACLTSLLKENDSLKNQVKKLEEEKFHMSSSIRVLREDLETERSLTSDLEAQLKLASQASKDIEAQRNLVLTLIDGDGYVFNPELLKKGEEGGREAAALLSDGIKRHISAQPIHPSKPKLWTIVFASKDNLETVLMKANSCKTEQFKLFVKGFTQAHSLFYFVEAGAGKEAADHKIRAHLTQFRDNPILHQIILGVDHDNGYSAALSETITAGYRDKLMILKGHENIVSEIQRLNLETAYIDGLFLGDKLAIPSPSYSRSFNSYAGVVTASPASSSALSLRSDTPASDGKPYVPPGKREFKHIKRIPPACNLFYLRGDCKYLECPYGHGYNLSDEEIKQLAIGARQQPCKYANEDKDCFLEGCIYGHKCPRGRQCSFREQGRCKFVGNGMHNE